MIASESHTTKNILFHDSLSDRMKNSKIKNAKKSETMSLAFGYPALFD